MGMNWQTAAFLVAVIVVAQLLATRIQDGIDKARAATIPVPDPQQQRNFY